MVKTIYKAFGLAQGKFFAEGELMPLAEEQRALLDK